MSNPIVEFVKDIPELFLFWWPLIIITVMAFAIIVCYIEWIRTKKSVPFWKFAYHWWIKLFFGSKENAEKQT